MKSSKDFYSDTGEGSHSGSINLDSKESNNKPQKIIIPYIKNKIFTMSLGNHLHHYLRMLSKHPLETILSQLSHAYLSEKEKEKIQKGLEYISHLKNPDFNSFFKNWRIRMVF